MYPVSIIVATDDEGGFGKDGAIPWINEPFATKDLRHFKSITDGNVCIMGRKTYQDMLKFRLSKIKKKDKITEILPGRESFVVTSEKRLKTPGAKVVKNIREAIHSLPANDSRTVFVIGGERMYIEALPWTSTIYMTVIKKRYKCDKFFPIKALKDFAIKHGEQEGEMQFLTYERVKG